MFVSGDGAHNELGHVVGRDEIDGVVAAPENPRLPVFTSGSPINVSHVSMYAVGRMMVQDSPLAFNSCSASVLHAEEFHRVFRGRPVDRYEDEVLDARLLRGLDQGAIALQIHRPRVRVARPAESLDRGDDDARSCHCPLNRVAIAARRPR